MLTRRKGANRDGRWAAMFGVLVLGVWGSLGGAGCGEDQTAHVGSSADDGLVDQIGMWEQHDPVFDTTYYVRPPGQTYGIGDGSSWEDAFSGLPEVRVRGARYLFASGEYFEPAAGLVENYVFDDPDDSERFIGLFKATADAHGTDTGWEASLGEGPAEFGPLSFVTGYYIVDGVTGAGTEGYGFRISHRDCELRATEFIASPIFFPWNAEVEYLVLSHVEVEDCGNHDDPTTRSQCAIYSVVGPSHMVLRDSYIRDAWRNLIFLQGTFDLLIQDVYLARAGLHHEASAIALRDTRNVVIQRNVIMDSVNVYISLQGTRNVTISSNLLTRSLADWDNWSAIFSQEPALNILIAGNTFYNLEGLNTGIRFTSTTDHLEVVNNLWAGCHTNQIMLNGEHHHNGFWDNWRVDGAEPVSLDDRIEEDTAQLFTADPFVDAENYDLRLMAPTEPGVSLDHPFAQTDLDGASRGADGAWDRGAFELAQ